MKREEMAQHDFGELGIAPNLLKRMRELGFQHPTPIQFKAIPIATSGEDVVGVAQTGSGKTLAFSIPLLQHASATKTLGLVLLPTRELAIQVEEVIKKVGGPFGLRTAILIGGTNANPQIKQLRAKPHVIVATPGRLIDLMEQKHVSLSKTGMLVLDEADRMLDMGFAPQLRKILAVLPENRQTMLFSATMPEEIAKIARQYMRTPLRIEVARPGTTASKVDQEVIMVPKSEKMSVLEKLLGEHRGAVLVFSRTKYGAKKIARVIRQMGHSADELHSNRSQNQRQKALKAFANGSCRILVATDIAARGIDVDDIQLVINYDLPDQIEDYVHRIGRTGRAGRSGKAVSLASPDQKADIAQIQKLINITLPIKSATGEELESITHAQPVSNDKKKKHSRQRKKPTEKKSERKPGASNSRRGGKRRRPRNMKNKKQS